jgi:hypothetical protein
MIDLQRLKDLLEGEKTITEAAKKLAKEKRIPYSDKFRRNCSRALSKEKNDLENSTYTDTNQYTATVVKTEIASPLSALKPDGTIMSIEEYCKHYNIPFSQVRTFKLVTHTGKGAYYNIASNPLETEHFKDFYKDLLKDLENIKGRPTNIFRLDSVAEESYLLVLDPADVHIGKLASSFETGEDYNNQIAVQRVQEGVEGILHKVKGFKIDKILFIGGNDILHIDTPKRTTTSGTTQDTDGMWYTNFLIAKQLYIETINRLLEVADVHFTFNPSNHDWTHGWFLADVIKTYFKDCKNITFDCDINHRKYFTYYNNLIGTTHGDGAKTQDLPLLMAQESKDWSTTKHRYIYTHHVHHKNAKDYIGVTVESLRSPSSADGWHSRNGYQHAPKAIEGFLHSKEHGQVARLTHIF